MNIIELLTFAIKNNASDLHLSAGMPPLIRVDGEIRRINVPHLEQENVQEFLYDTMNEKQQREFQEQQRKKLSMILLRKYSIGVKTRK